MGLWLSLAVLVDWDFERVLRIKCVFCFFYLLCFDGWSRGNFSWILNNAVVVGSYPVSVLNWFDNITRLTVEIFPCHDKNLVCVRICRNGPFSKSSKCTSDIKFDHETNGLLCCTSEAAVCSYE